ncbi:hypothetical protein M0L20_07725 [Spirosoma sp. RP8]|uniref:WG repeat-containing protein n=1 Tax=Spirosoma liriopis TaxID=2937440 RepID=A0ABT0HIM9_9BACT|nr:hypothetical protein [Spirosoma liriopis]MCK8491737.1 hypothetical protein [Spirosoma liriopis]
MKMIHFSINLPSFFLGSLTVIGILLLTNFTSDPNKQPDPNGTDNRRFQAVSSERESIILDTKTGRFVVMPSYLGKPRWINADFEEIRANGKK